MPRPPVEEGTALQDSGDWFTPAAPTAPAPEVAAPARITLVLSDTGAPFSLSGADRYMIGREDAGDGIFPDLDLTLCGGAEAGVSRKHATLTNRDGTYWLEDQDSRNYTFVNGVRLNPFHPHPLRDGDEIELGNLRLRFYLG